MWTCPHTQYEKASRAVGGDVRLSVNWPEGKRRTVALGGDNGGCAGLGRAASVRGSLVVLVETQRRGVGARPHGSQRCLKVCTAHALRLQALLERCQRSLAADGLDGKRAAKPVSMAAPQERLHGCTTQPKRPQLCSGAQGGAVRRREGASSRRWWGAYLSLPGRRGEAC